MSWIITYPPEYYLKLGGEEQQTRWVYNFNGVNSHIQFSSVELTPSDTLSFKLTNFTSPNAVGARFVGSEDFSFSVDAGASGSKFRLVNCTAKLNGVPIESEVTEIPTSGIHDVEVTPLITASINAIGCKSGTFDRLIKASIFDFKINDGSVYNYPINDRTFSPGAPIANSATVLGSNLWGGQNLTVANVGLVTTVVSGEEWDVYSLNGSPLNVVHGARVNVFSGLTDGEQYLYDVDSSEPVNIAVYNTNYQLISGGTVENGKGILFTHNGTSRVYVYPRTTNTVRVSNGRVRLANGYATGVNLLESGWTETNL